MKDFDLQPTLKGKLVELRPLSNADFSELYRAASDPLIWEQHPMPDRYKEAVFLKFFSNALKSQGTLVVINLETQKMIGCSSYYEFDSSRSQIVIGYTFLEREFWGGVYNDEIKNLMLRHAFKYVKRVEFHVDENNFRSQKAMGKIGGHRVGQFQKLKPNGSSRTVFIYEVLR